MSYDLKIELSAQAEELLRTLPQAPARASEAIAKALDYQNELTIGYAQKNKLSASSSTTLGVRTGLLRRSLRRTNATITGTTIEGAIGSNVKYAGVHEYGFEGEVSVKSFVRRNRRADLLNAKTHKLVASGISFVRAFTRQMRMPERSFIRSSIAERLGQYDRALSQAVVDALGGTT